MSRRTSPPPRHHERVTVPVPGHPEGMRVVLTAEGPLQSLVDYFDHLGVTNPTRQRNAAMAVGMLYDFYVATRPTEAAEHARLLSRFARVLRIGTVEADGSDPLDLNWFPVAPSRAREILRQVTAFSDYCALEAGTVPLNPMVPATFPQRIAQYRHLEKQSAASLLKHTFAPGAAWARASRARQVPIPGVPTKAEAAPPSFPFAHTTRLFSEGFRRGGDEGPMWKRYHIRDQMIELLQRFGGLRVSEPFHLFVGDVEPEILDWS